MGLGRIVKKVVSAPVKAVQQVTKALPTPLKTVLAPVTMTNLAVLQAKKNPAQLRSVMMTNAAALAIGTAAAPLAGVSMTTLSPAALKLAAAGKAAQASASKYRSYAGKLKGLAGRSMSSTAKSPGESIEQMPALPVRRTTATKKYQPKRKVVYLTRAQFERLRRSY